jgi:hypothetical protein
MWNVIIIVNFFFGKIYKIYTYYFVINKFYTWKKQIKYKIYIENECTEKNKPLLDVLNKKRIPKK